MQVIQNSSIKGYRNESNSIKAIVYTKYGGPEVLQIKEMEKPVPKDNEILVKVHVTTVNRTDFATIRAKPFFMRLVTGLLKPKKQIPGTEFAGEIEAVGKDVKDLKVGDRVFGFDDMGSGAHAQYLTVTEDKALTIPDNITCEQAAPVPKVRIMLIILGSSGFSVVKIRNFFMLSFLRKQESSRSA